MSTHDTHTPVQESKGIWLLPLIAVILTILIAWYFTRDKSGLKNEPAAEKTEATH